MLQDQDNESLQRYKKALLGDLADETLFNGEPGFVEIVKVELLCPERPNGPIVLDIKESDRTGIFKIQSYSLKQKSTVQMRVTFKVYNDIVQGLKYCSVVKKAGFVVEKNEEVLGTFAPVPNKEYVASLEPDETPGGMLMRGEYKGKSMFIDNDGIVHMQFEYTFNIKKTWD